jgi:hypothetical protein
MPFTINTCVTLNIEIIDDRELSVFLTSTKKRVRVEASMMVSSLAKRVIGFSCVERQRSDFFN